MTYFFDQKLLFRIKQHIEAHGIDQSDINTLADSLQNQYSEYRRKKRGPFVKTIQKACNVINGRKKNFDESEKFENEYLIQKAKNRHKDDEDAEHVSSSSDDMENIIYEDSNAVNSMISDCYKKSSQPNKSLAKNTDPGTMPSSLTDHKLPSAKKVNKFTISAPLSSEVVTKENNASKTDTAKNGNKVIEDPAKEKVLEEVDVEMVTPKQSTKKRKKSALLLEDQEIKKSKTDQYLSTPTVCFADIGGCDKILSEVCQLLLHLKHPEIYNRLGVTPPQGLLLHGPPGCGKTLLANAIAGEIGLPFIKVSAPEIVKGVSGESEEKLRELFASATNVAPCILFIDEIDAITPKRENVSKEMERRIVAQLLTCLDDLNSSQSSHVLVIGATNRADSLDPALRRAGRFDREVCLGIPDEDSRHKILQVMSRKLRLSPDVDLCNLAHLTPGYVGADLSALIREAAVSSVNRTFQKLNNPPQNEELQTEMVHEEELTFQTLLSWLKETSPLSDDQLSGISLFFCDFQVALQKVQPSAKREGFATVPDVTWEDIGALKDIRDELQMAILAPVHHRKEFESLGLKKPPGILLAGPPGCGKTLLAKAIANESGINFISVKGPELLNMYVGESERAVRQVFTRARNSAPCVIFFDELDALCPQRGSSGEGGSSVRVVNQMLTEMDGLEDRRHVYVMAATNRPDIIDPAILRPGRLDKILYVGLPSLTDRLDILKTITKDGTMPKLADDILLETVAKICENYSGADLSSIVREASVIALRERITSNEASSENTSIQVSKNHFMLAFDKIKPSVSSTDHDRYLKIQKRFTAT